jgi:hypothetical protein
MPIRIAVTRIDRDGFTGRAPHPPDELAGEQGLIFGCRFDPAIELIIYEVYVVERPEVFELLEHEFTVVGLDQSRSAAAHVADAAKTSPHYPPCSE